MTNLIALPSGTELVGDYRIERVLGAGGFGVTYLADEIALSRAVTIKEYFPSDFAARADGVEAAPRSQGSEGDYKWGLDRFIEEAQTLAKFNHPNIVRVYRYFRANNTGYMVLHFEEGKSLKNWLKSLGRAPRQKELDAIIEPLLDALELIHASDFLHRDIAPDNIIIRKAGDPVLIDFGSARGEIASHSKTVSALVKPGYSPYEQYAETSKQQGPWTDIYALGATLYHAVTGKRPPDAPSRMVKDEIVPARDAALSSYRAGFLKAIDHALALNFDARPQSIAAWRKELFAPEPARPGWLTLGKKPKPAEPEPIAASPAPVPVAPAAAPVAAAAAKAEAPKPAKPGFFEGLLKKPEGEKIAVPAGAAETVKMDSPPPPAPKIFQKAAAKKAEQKKKAAAKKAPPKKAVAKGRALVVDNLKTPRPRPVKGSRRSWMSLAFKLLVGVGVASAAVAMQDRIPGFEKSGRVVSSSEQTAALRTSPQTTAAIPRKRTTNRAESSAPEITLVGEIDAHSGPITSIAYSDDGRWIVTAGDDATIKLWDASSNAPVRTIALNDGRATSLALNGKRALTGHENGKVVLWNLDTGLRLETFQRNEASIWAVTFAGGPNRFATASHDWMVALWDVNTPTAPLHVMEGHKSAVQSLAMSPRDQYLISGSADKTVRLWNLETLQSRRRYRGHRDFVTALAFAGDGKLFAAAALDGRIRVWSTRSTRTRRQFRGHQGKVAALAFSPVGDLLVSAGEDGTVRLWDTRRGKAVRALTGHTGGATAVAFAHDGQRLASAGANGQIRLWAMPPAKLAKD